jgi:flagellar biosynthesis protein FlhF
MKSIETGLKIKSYFAATVTEAISNARHELGSDAMLLTTRRTGPEAQHLGEYEVVFALVPNASTSELPGNSKPSAAVLNSSKQAATNSKPPADALPFQVNANPESRARAIERTQTDPVQQSAPAGAEAEPTAPLRPVLKRLRDAVGGTRERYAVESPYGLAMASLRSAGFEEELCREIALEVKKQTEARFRALKRGSSGKADGSHSEAAEQVVRDAVALELKRRVVVDPVLGRAGSGRRVIALIGPPGAGKTTTLVKLALKYGLAARRSFHLISMDNYRVAAADQLRAYAHAIGCGCDIVDSIASLAHALESCTAELVLIDTPGLGAADVASFKSLASFLSSNCDIEVQLVLPAHASAQNLARISSRFKPFLPSSLIFTNLDEADSTAAVLAEALRTELPVAYLGTGQLIPEDLEEADSETLVARFISSATFAAASAA